MDLSDCLPDDIVVNNSGVHEKEATNLISKYLSKLTFTDADGLRLPTDEKLPQGFIFSHWRSSRRTLYTPRPGFTMIVSKERSWCSDLRDEENRVTVGNVFVKRSVIIKRKALYVGKLTISFTCITEVACFSRSQDEFVASWRFLQGAFRIKPQIYSCNSTH